MKIQNNASVINKFIDEALGRNAAHEYTDGVHTIKPRDYDLHKALRMLEVLSGAVEFYADEDKWIIESEYPCGTEPKNLLSGLDDGNIKAKQALEQCERIIDENH